MAVTPAVVLLDGNVLRIGGTDAADDIAIAAGRVQFQVHANGQVHAFNTADVRLIRISGGRGDDSIIVSPNLPIRTAIEGGPGNDRIGGGGNNDTILGQQGNDTLVGNEGHDYLAGGEGDDHLEDDSALNALHGGPGNDSSRTPGEFVLYSSGIENIDNGSYQWDARVTVFRRHEKLLVSFEAYQNPENSYRFTGPARLDDGSAYLRLRNDVDPNANTGADGGSAGSFRNVTGADGVRLSLTTNVISLFNDHRERFTAFVLLLPGWDQ